MLGFVEGSMERQFVNANFGYVRVVPVQNGITWTTERICKQIVTSYLALNYYGEIFVWLDREGRIQSAEEIKFAVFEALVNAGANPDLIFILVNDRMTENLILADEGVIRTEFELNDGEYEYEFEGKGGKSILKRLYSTKDICYKEMVQGCNLLKRVRLSKAAIKSPSVNSFIRDCSINCWWF